jgi:hypothetical protein
MHIYLYMVVDTLVVYIVLYIFIYVSSIYIYIESIDMGYEICLRLTELGTIMMMMFS